MGNVLIIKGCLVIDDGQLLIDNNYGPCKSSLKQDLCFRMAVLIHNNMVLCVCVVTSMSLDQLKNVKVE